MIESVDEVQPEVPIEERLGVKTIEVVLMNFENDNILEYNEIVKALISYEYYRYHLKLELDMKNRETALLHLPLNSLQYWSWRHF